LIRIKWADYSALVDGARGRPNAIDLSLALLSIAFGYVKQGSPDEFDGKMIDLSVLVGAPAAWLEWLGKWPAPLF